MGSLKIKIRKAVIGDMDMIKALNKKLCVKAKSLMNLMRQ